MLHLKLVFLSLLATSVAGFVGAQSQEPPRGPCLQLKYDSTASSNRPSLYPRLLTLLEQGGQHTIQIRDSVKFSYWPGATHWSRSREGYSLFLEAGESGISLRLTVQGDSLVGWAARHTDRVGDVQYRTPVVALEVPCADDP